jgi:predicted patatin/cPLA2 family phospholipase
MKLKDTALILEGGGMRGVYSSGVLHFLMEKEIYLPYVIGVSMGACNAANYLARQIERNKIVNIDFLHDSRYISYFRLLSRGELFGMQFIFDTIPNKLVPFDYQTFYANEAKCLTTVTDCETGEPRYFEKNELGKDYMLLLQASSSLPFISHPVKYAGHIYMDGGMSDSIPIHKSIADGNRKHVLILTQPKGYRKQPESLAKFAKYRYPRLKGLQKALTNRHAVYNEAITFIEQAEDRGEVFVFRPNAMLAVSRVERDKEKLRQSYALGYADAAEHYARLQAYLNL